MVNHWIFIARRTGGTLPEMRKVIKGGIWDFVSRESEPKTPQHHKELSTGDFVLFYLAATFPDNKPIEGGRSIIGRARLGSPYLIYGRYIEKNKDEETERFVFLLEPDTKFSKEIEPSEYGIGGHPGQMVIKISKIEYDGIVK